MTGRLLTGLAAIVCLGVLTVAPAGASSPVATYEVTIENLTGGQPYTPPLIATHRTATGIFSVGQAASFELREIAENGNLGPMMAALGSDRHVFDWGVAGGPVPLLAGASVELTLTAARGAKFLSFASMLICTNDGFTGVDSLRLPTDIGEQVVVSTNAYDSGTEINTEDYKDIVPPCQSLHGVTVEPGTGTSNPLLAEGSIIDHHPGIDGRIADLTRETHGWANPVAAVTVERIS